MFAWKLSDETSGKPVFYSKNKWDDEQSQLSFKDMTIASGTNPMYFKPYKIGESFYISGEIFSISPALYAYYYAREVA